MLRSYLAAALRNLSRNRLYSFIGVTGLAVGLAAALLIVLFVRDELSYDTYRPSHERTFLVGETIRIAGATPIVIGASPAELASWAKDDVPAIEAITRLLPRDSNVSRGLIEARETVSWADANFFDVMPQRALAGDLSRALAEPGGLVITRAMARKYFGREAPLGEVLEVGEEKFQMRVTAVVEDAPFNTHLDAQLFLSASTAGSPLITRDALRAPLASGNNNANMLTYVRLRPGADPDAAQRAIEAGVARRAPAAASLNLAFPLHAISTVHLHPELRRPAASPDGTRTTVYAVGAVAVLIVFVAVINLVNLLTARAARRAMEIGVRKAAGAHRTDLMLQFVGESLLYVACGMLLAIALAELLLPHFNAFLGKAMEFPYWSDPRLAGLVLLATLLLGALSGVYPAFVLSSFAPVAILKGRNAAGGGSSIARLVLVTSQFAVLIGLLVCTAVIYRQTRFALQESLRFGDDQIMLMQGRCRDGLRESIAALPGVSGIGCSSSAPTIDNSTQSPALLEDGTQVLLWYGAADEDYFGLYGLSPLAGRSLSRARASDTLTPTNPDATEALVINETAARKLRFPTPQAAIGKSIRCVHALSSDPGRRGSGMRTCEIVGVFPDRATASVRNAIEPSAWYMYPPQYDVISVKLRGQQVPETLGAIDRLWKELGDGGALRRNFLEERVQALYVDITRQARILGAFSSVAVLLGCLGLLGLSAFTAERRTREIGVRKAMGAATGDIVKLLAWQFTRPVLWANLIAWPLAAYAMSRWLQGFAYHIDLEPWVFAAASVAALLIALLTVGAHCVLAARVRPAVSLRTE